MPAEEKWDVDEETLVTLHDMSKLKAEFLANNSPEFSALLKDLKTVFEIGRKIKNLQQELKWVQAKRMYEKINSIKSDIKALEKRRDFFDEKYETTRF